MTSVSLCQAVHDFVSQAGAADHVLSRKSVAQVDDIFSKLLGKMKNDPKQKVVQVTWSVV